MKDYKDKPISACAEITKKHGIWTHIVCHDLPVSNHNHLINIVTALPVKTKGTVVYRTGLNYGTLIFKKD